MLSSNPIAGWGLIGVCSPVVTVVTPRLAYQVMQEQFRDYEAQTSGNNNEVMITTPIGEALYTSTPHCSL